MVEKIYFLDSSALMTVGLGVSGEPLDFWAPSLIFQRLENNTLPATALLKKREISRLV